jgi:Tfp pilus assembly protein PilV
MTSPSFPRLQRSRQRGVTLIEALIALVVMSLGMLAFAGLHSKLRLNSDVSRQRAEAVRLAQEDMENLRSFWTTQVAASSTNSPNSYQNITAGLATRTSTALASGNTTGLNTSYTITRTVQDVGNLMKNLSVVYGWTDRAGAAQTVQLRSTIAGLDPKLSAAMATAPNGSPIKDPLGRDVQIPIPAKDIGGGKSVFKPTQGGPLAFVFNNDSGLIKQRCESSSLQTTKTIDITASTITGLGSACEDVTGYILSGYIRWALGNSPNPDQPDSSDPPGSGATIALALDGNPITSGAPFGTLERLRSSYWAPTAPSSSGYPRTPDCAAEYSKTVRFTQLNISPAIEQVNNGVSTFVTTTIRIAIVPASVDLSSTLTRAANLSPYVGVAALNISDIVDTNERYIGYTCAVYPTSTLGGSTTELVWTGRTTVVPNGWTIGTASGTYKVCRYSTDANKNSYIWSPNVAPDSNSGTTLEKIDNAEHPNAYIRVNGGLSNQNFLIIKGTEVCKVDGTNLVNNTEINGQGQENYSDSDTSVHQDGS